MAEQDEYQFHDPDANPPQWGGEAPEPAVVDHAHGYAENITSSLHKHPMVIRNALIAVFTLVFGILLYKVIHNLYVRHTVAVPKPQPIVTKQQVVEPPVAPQPIVHDNTAVIKANIDDKLSMVTESQQNVQTELASMTQNVNNMETQMTEVSANMANMSQLIEALQAKVTEQSQLIENLLAVRKHEYATKHHYHRRHTHASTLKYYVQAVIPGRAWLIATNGVTLTVRQGTAIRGYGIVQFIDATRGRVMTSSGKVIKFSQEDS